MKSRKLAAAALLGVAIGTPGAVFASVKVNPAGPVAVRVLQDPDGARREAADLHAQEVAAWWTRFAALMSVPALGLSGFGLFIILDQLKAAQRQLAASDLATREARKSADAASAAARVALLSTRPWIKMQVRDPRIDLRNNMTVIRHEVTYRNVGQTPALHLDVLTQYVAPLVDHAPQKGGPNLEAWAHGMRDFDVLVGRETVFHGERGENLCAITVPAADVGADGWQVDVAITYQMAGEETFVVAERFIVTCIQHGLFGAALPADVQGGRIVNDDNEKRIHT